MRQSLMQSNGHMLGHWKFGSATIGPHTSCVISEKRDIYSLGFTQGPFQETPLF